jgi:hypothetical protein
MVASETPHRITLFLRLHPPLSINGSTLHPASNISFDRVYPLQAELFKDKWQSLGQNLMPCYVYLAPDKLLLLNDDVKKSSNQPDLWRANLNADSSKITPRM